MKDANVCVLIVSVSVQVVFPLDRSESLPNVFNLPPRSNILR